MFRANSYKSSLYIIILMVTAKRAAKNVFKQNLRLLRPFSRAQTVGKHKRGFPFFFSIDSSRAVYLRRLQTEVDYVPRKGLLIFLLFFLTIFRNEITTILTPSTSEGGEWLRWWWSRFTFWRSLITNPQC